MLALHKECTPDYAPTFCCEKVRLLSWILHIRTSFSLGWESGNVFVYINIAFISLTSNDLAFTENTLPREEKCVD